MINQTNQTTPPSGGAKIKLDPTRLTGTQLRRINGGNLGPNMSSLCTKAQSEFKMLEIPLTRLHDAPLTNPGMRLVDIQHIFGNWNASTEDPDNYYFAQTDEYLRRILAAGSQIVYRLGTSIEHLEPHYYAFPPPDFKKWTEIALHIIRHYNRGWANGFHHDIRYWEIWNEPDDSRCTAPAPSKMWNGTPEQFYDLYEISAKRIKAEFPEVKIGGASFWSIVEKTGRGEEGFISGFLESCRDRKVPLDFFSWHSYASPRHPFRLLKEPQQARELLDSYGFTQTELHLSEWRYMESWDPIYMRSGEHGMGSMRSAAHTAAVLCGWQDTPLDMSLFYTIGEGSGVWGIWVNRDQRTKIFYAFLAFAELLHTPQRFEAHSEHPQVFVSAGKDDRNHWCALISDFCGDCGELDVEFSVPIQDLRIQVLDPEHNLEEINISPVGTRLCLPAAPGGSILYLLSGNF